MFHEWCMFAKQFKYAVVLLHHASLKDDNEVSEITLLCKRIT